MERRGLVLAGLISNFLASWKVSKELKNRKNTTQNICILFFLCLLEQKRRFCGLLWAAEDFME